ncbi:MAG TPA: hypothetical protein VFE65_08410 [Pseudonocardia sp.]|jgi:hypothetical protein|nr:hypothetical protein [Pseudonocardia sp.]
MISRLPAAVRTDVDELITETIGDSCPVRLPPTPGAHDEGDQPRP